MDARLCAQQECCDQNLYVLPEPNDNLTNLKAVESTASTPETPERCELTSMIEPSVSRILGNVALALELRRLTLSPFCAAQEQRQKHLGRAGRATRQPSGHRAARSARTPMTDAVIVQGCAVLAGDGLAAALDGQTVCLRACWRLSYAVLSCA